MRRKTLLTTTLITGMLCGVSSPASAGFEPFIGEITWFAGNFAPRGWAECDGQLLPINQNQALFSILGTTYGGDGRTNFALPDARGRVLLHEGHGPGLSSRPLGGKGGTETVALTSAEMPNHTHALRASGGSANNASPAGNVLAGTGRTRIYEDGNANTSMNANAIGSTGNGSAHNNMSPYNTLTCIIALQGLFPSRN